MSQETDDAPMPNESNLLESTVKMDDDRPISNSEPHSFDQMPIGGKKFQFSEYPAEGEQAPKPKKTAKKSQNNISKQNEEEKPETVQNSDKNQSTITNGNTFDEMPIGGKKFQFSQFPEEGQPVKKVVKKPPARFAKKMQEAQKQKVQKEKDRETFNTNQETIEISIDQRPIGGGSKVQMSEFPDQNQVKPVKKEKVKPKAKPKQQPTQFKSHTQEINIEGSKIPGEFDELPIGKSSTVQMSEFPDGEEQTPVETNYTLQQKLKSKAVKLRLSGMEDLLALLQSDSNSPDLGIVEMGKLLKQTNPACLQKILQCFEVWVKEQKKWDDHEVKLAIESGYINGKTNTKKLTIQITDLMYQKRPDVVEMTLMIGLKGKVPKTLAGYIAIINQLLSIYGMKRMKFMKPYLGDIVTIMNRQKLIAVKNEGVSLLKQFYKWMTKEVADNFLKDLKQPLKKQLDSFWESYDKNITMTAPKDIDEGGDKKTKKKIDAYDLSTAVDIFKKYDEKFSEKVLKEEKWNLKVKMLEEFVNAASVPKLAHSDYRHISEMTRRLINHSNFNVVLWTLKILAVLSKGLRRHFYQTVKSQFSNVISKFRDKKTQMIDETFHTLNDFTYSISLEDVVQDLKEGLGDKAPNMKVNLINWIGKFVEKKIEEKDELPDKAANALKSLFPTFTKLLGDGVADVRDVMVKNIGKMKILIGEDFFAEMDKNMTKGQASKLQQAKKQMPKRQSREKQQKQTPMKGGKTKQKTMENNSSLSNVVSSSNINDDIQGLIPKMNHSDWQKRKQSAEAIIQIFTNNGTQKLNFSCLSDLLSTLKNRIADPNKNIVKYFVQLTSLVFQLMSDRDVKNNAKNFMAALTDGLSDKMQSNRVQICHALNKIGQIYGKEQLLTLLGSCLENDKDSRVEILNLILENEEYLQKADTKEYPKGIIKGLTDKNREIRSLSQKLFERIQEKVGLDIFKNLAKNQRPAIAKDLNSIFSRYEGKSTQSIVSRNSPPKMKQPPAPVSAKKINQRSLSKGSRSQINPYDEQKLMYSTIQANSSFIKSEVKSFIEGNQDFAPLKVLASERVQRQENDERTPWICDSIKDTHEEELVESINSLFNHELAKKMMSMDHRKVNQACQQILRLCKDISHQNQFREIYDLIFKWVFVRLWGGNPAIQSIIEVLPPVMSILQKKKLAINDSEVEIIVAILREYFITGYMNEYKVSESLYTITKCLIHLSSGDRLLRKFLRQFTIQLTTIHRHIRKQATSFYRDGLNKLIKNQLMEYVGNGGTLEEASRIRELKNDPEFVELLYKRFHENVLDSFGFRPAHHQQSYQQPPPPPPPRTESRQTNHPPPSQIKKQEESLNHQPPRSSIQQRKNTNNHANFEQSKSSTKINVSPPPPPPQNNNKEEIMDISIYPMPHPASPLGKHLAKIHPPNQSTISFFNSLLMQSGEKIPVELTTYAKVIFGSILKSVENLLDNRNEYSPEQIISQINLLQQSIKCKYIINNIGELLYFGTKFALLQLVYEDENKTLILTELQRRGIDFKVEQFIKVINGVMLRILENACPQETVNILLKMLNRQTSSQNTSQKTVSLIVKCMTRVASNYSMDINQERTKCLIKMGMEYFSIINLQFGLEHFNPSPDEKLKTEESILRTIKNILNELIKHYGEEIWNHYDNACKESKFKDNHIAPYFDSLRIPYPDNTEVGEQEDQEIKRITDLLSKTKSFEMGIVELKKYIGANPQFSPTEFFTNRGFDQKFIFMVMTAIDPRKAKKTPTKREIRQQKSQNARRPTTEQINSQANIQDRIQRLRMRFDQIQPKQEDETSTHKEQTQNRIREEDKSQERAAQIKRRIDEMKSRLARN